MKSITSLLSILGIFVISLISCQKVNDRTNAQLIIKASESPLKSAVADISATPKSSAAALSTIVLDSFLINLKDIEFEFDESYTGYNGSSEIDDDDEYDDDGNEYDDDDDDIYDDLEFEGPYLIDILSPEVLNGMVLDNFSVPTAIYDEIEFDIAPYRRTDNDKMSNRSIYLAFTMDGKPYELWTNKAKEIEIEFDDDQAVSLTEEDIRLFINISLEKIKSNLETLQLGTAVDGNNNGIIEIGHDDLDGNSQLAGSLLYVLMGCFDLDHDDDHDDDD